MKLFAISMLLQVGYLLNNIRLIAFTFAALLAFFFLIFLMWRPYKKAFFQIALLTSQLTAVYSASLPLIGQLVTVEEQFQILLIFSLQGLIALNIVFGVVRLIIVYWAKCSHWWNIEEQSKKVELKSFRKRGKSSDAIIKAETALPADKPDGILAQAKQKQIELASSKREDDKTLKELKERLRGDLRKKRKKVGTQSH